METLDPTLVGILSLTSGIGLAMMWLGGRMHMLEPRQPQRRCPSCGVLVKNGTGCRCSG